jgi:N-acetylglucosamine-6-sulfatase
MAAVDQPGRLLLSGKTCCAALVLLAACLLVGCGPSSKGEVAEVGDGAHSGTATSDESVEQPNIILILTDDLADDDLSYMPNLRSLLVEQGTTFENAFVTDSLCCPSRATILRGQYAHNHGILENGPPNGGYEKFRSLGRQNSTLATWLQDAGYRTVLIGKYMNDYEGTQVPPGWDDWHAVSGNYTSHDLSENGKIVSYDPGSYYMTDVLADKAVDFIRDPDGHVPSFLVPSRPFFMWLGTTAPHQPADPAPRHANAFSEVSMPRPPSFDEGDVSDKPAWIRDNPPLDPEQIAYAEDLYRKRMQSMLAVDDMIGRLVGELRKSGELDNTYFFFTSDNGFHFGTHRLSVGKWTAYEEDISVPLIVRGPGVPKGRTLEHLVLNNDFAPTFADLGGAEIPDFVDGRTLRPLLSDDPPPTDDWRQAFLEEAMAESAVAPASVTEEAGPRLLTGDVQPSEEVGRASPLQKSSVKEAGRPALKAVRTRDHLYVEYENGESELYDLEKDPYELDNVYEDADLDQLWRYEGWLGSLRDCAGEDCRAAEDAGP